MFATEYITKGVLVVVEDIKGIKKEIAKELLNKNIDIHKLKKLLYVKDKNTDKATSRF